MKKKEKKVVSFNLILGFGGEIRREQTGVVCRFYDLQHNGKFKTVDKFISWWDIEKEER